MTVLELLDRMTAWEFSHWVALFELDNTPQPQGELIEG